MRTFAGTVTERRGRAHFETGKEPFLAGGGVSNPGKIRIDLRIVELVLLGQRFAEPWRTTREEPADIN
jgi:hypothetical protein